MDACQTAFSHDGGSGAVPGAVEFPELEGAVRHVEPECDSPVRHVEPECDSLWLDGETKPHRDHQECTSAFPELSRPHFRETPPGSLAEGPWQDLMTPPREAGKAPEQEASEPIVDLPGAEILDRHGSVPRGTAAANPRASLAFSNAPGVARETESSSVLPKYGSGRAGGGEEIAHPGPTRTNQDEASSSRLAGSETCAKGRASESSKGPADRSFERYIPEGGSGCVTSASGDRARGRESFSGESPPEIRDDVAAGEGKPVLAEPFGGRTGGAAGLPMSRMVPAKGSWQADVEWHDDPDALYIYDSAHPGPVLPVIVPPEISPDALPPPDSIITSVQKSFNRIPSLPRLGVVPSTPPISESEQVGSNKFKQRWLYARMRPSEYRAAVGEYKDFFSRAVSTIKEGLATSVFGAVDEDEELRLEEEKRLAEWIQKAEVLWDADPMAAVPVGAKENMSEEDLQKVAPHIVLPKEALPRDKDDEKVEESFEDIPLEDDEEKIKHGYSLFAKAKLWLEKTKSLKS